MRLPGLVEIWESAQSQEFLGLKRVAVRLRQLGEVEVDLSSPPRVRRLVHVLQAPVEIVLGGLPFSEHAGQLGVYHTRYPPHYVDVPSRFFPGIFKNADRVLYPAVPAKQEHLVCVARPQSPDGRQVKGLLRVGKARSELFQQRGNLLGTFAVKIRVGVLPHQEEQQLRILGRTGAIDRLEILQLRPRGTSRRAAVLIHCKRNCHGARKG